MQKQRSLQLLFKNSESQSPYPEPLPAANGFSKINNIIPPGSPQSRAFPNSARKIVDPSLRQSRNLSQPRLAARLSMDPSARIRTIESPKKDILKQHELSLSGVQQPAVGSTGVILFQVNNQSNSTDNSYSINNNLSNSSLFNLDSSRRRAQQFIVHGKEDKLQGGVQLTSKQILQSHLPQRVKSLQLINTAALPSMNGLQQMLPQTDISTRNTKNSRSNNASLQYLSSPRSRITQPAQQLQPITSNQNAMQLPSSTNSPSFIQNNINSSLVMSNNSSRIEGIGGLSAGPTPKKSFYHHSNIFSVKQYRNLTGQFLKDDNENDPPDDVKESQRKALVRQFRRKVDHYIHFSKLRKDQAAKEFSQFYDRIKDTLFKEGSKKSNNSSSNNLSSLANSISSAEPGGRQISYSNNNGMSFFSNNNNNNTNENSHMLQEDSNISLSAIHAGPETNKSLMNIEASRFNYSKQQNEFPSIVDSINVEVYMEDQLGKQIRSTRPIDHRQLQDLLLDKLKPLLTNEDSYSKKMDLITKEYERVLQKIQTKSFKLKVPYYYEPLMQPFNDFYQIDLEKKRIHELRENDLDGQLLKQVIEEGGGTRRVSENLHHEENEGEYDQTDEEDDEGEEEYEVYEEEIVETDEEMKKRLMMEGNNSKQNEGVEGAQNTTSNKDDETKKNQPNGLVDSLRAVRQVVRVIKKKKKEKRHHHHHNQDDDQEGEDDLISSRRPPQGTSPTKGPIQKRQRAPRERSAMEEYLSYRPPSAKPKKKQIQMNLPAYVPPAMDEEPSEKQGESVNEQDVSSEKEEQIKPAKRESVEDYAPVRSKSPRKKRDHKNQNQEFVPSGKNPQRVPSAGNSPKKMKGNFSPREMFVEDDSMPNTGRRRKQQNQTSENQQNDNISSSRSQNTGQQQKQDGNNDSKLLPAAGDDKDKKRKQSSSSQSSSSSEEEEVVFEFADEQPKKEMPEEQADPEQTQTNKTGNNITSGNRIKFDLSKKNGQTVLPSTPMNGQGKNDKGVDKKQNITENIGDQTNEIGLFHDPQIPSKKRIGTGLIDELVKFQYLLDFDVDRFKMPKKAPELPKDLDFDEPEDRKLFDQIFQWQYEVDVEIEEKSKLLNVVREKNTKKKNKKQDDSDDDDDQDRDQQHMGGSNADNNSIHSSSITDFGPAAPLRESLNEVDSDDFSDLE